MVEPLLIPRRTVLKGIATGPLLAAAGPLLAGCEVGAATNIITWVGGIASVIGAVPAAKSIAEWVQSDGPDQDVGREVRNQFRAERDSGTYAEREPFTNENGAQVHRWSELHFFSAATEDGLGGCCAWIANGKLLQLVESKGAAALEQVVRTVKDEYPADEIARAFLPAYQAPEDSRIGNLMEVKDLFRYKAQAGDVNYELLAPEKVEITATLTDGRRTWHATIPKGLVA